MEPKVFSAIILFSVFSLLLVDATIPERTKDEEAYTLFEPSDYFSNLEYDLEFNVNGTSFDSNYWGRVYITMKCRKKTNKFFLDQKSININAKKIRAWELTETDDRQITVHYGKFVGEGTGYKIKLEEYMHVDITYKIRLEFSKSIIFGSVGFVSEYYRLHSSHPNLRKIQYTRMQESHARNVFPCFDVVEMKATFKIRIGHLKDVSSFTNAKFVSSQLIDNPEEFLNRLSDVDIEKLESTFCENECEGSSSNLPKIWVVDEFEKTHLISTFSVALAVVEYNSYGPAYRMIGPSGTDHEKVEIKIWAEEDILREHDMEEILRIAGQSLEFFSDFFDSKYTLGKLDLIILPDEDITVLDNYGLIYLGENAVKCDFKKSTPYETGRYLLVSKICRSMSRQWIGHLVSLINYREEWFYDGLHTYLERLCVIEMFPDWKYNIQLNWIDSFIKLLRDEESGEVYTLTAGLNPEIKSKINLVVRMLVYILELIPGMFQKTLTSFISENKAEALVLYDVWSSWTQSASAEVGSNILPRFITFRMIVEFWLHQRGHPIVMVVRNEDNTLMVYQGPVRFPGLKTSGLCWAIPFEIITKNQQQSDRENVRHWLTCAEPKLYIPMHGVNADDWIIVTSKLRVPGRVHYNQESWKLIQKLFHTEEVHLNVDYLTKVQLIHDMFTLAETSYLNYDFVLDTIKYISNEKDYTSWHVAHQELKRLRSRWIGTSLFEPLQEFVRTLIEPVFKERIVRIDYFLEEQYSNDMLGRIIIEAACTFELPECQEYSEDLLNKLMNNPNYKNTNQISESLRECFYCLAMKNADEKKLEFLLKKYEEKPNETWILRAVGCSRNLIILKNFLTWGLTVNNSRKLPLLSLEVFEILSSSDEGYQLIISYFKIRRSHLPNKNTVILNDFIAALRSDITIDDFLIKAIKVTKKSNDLKLLLKFSSTLKNRKTEAVKLKKAQKTEPDEAKQKKDQKTSEVKLEAIEIAKRNISWFEKEEKGVLQYFTNLSKVTNSPYDKILL